MSTKTKNGTNGVKKTKRKYTKRAPGAVSTRVKKIAKLASKIEQAQKIVAQLQKKLAKTVASA